MSGVRPIPIPHSIQPRSAPADAPTGSSAGSAVERLGDEQYRKVMRYGWNLAPAAYLRVWTPVLREYSMGCVERARVRGSDRVLDVATGPGTAAIVAADRASNVVGVDISDRFVEIARAAAAGRPNLRFARQPMERLDLPDRSFDAALCVLGLMYAAPAAAALSEIARVVVPRGRFAACVWGRRERCAFREMFPILAKRLPVQVCPLFFSLGVEGALCDALEQAGFEDVDEDRVEAVIRWRDGEEACAAVFDGGPAALPFSTFPAEVRRAVRGEYVASLAAYRSGEGFEAPVELVYATARRSPDVARIGPFWSNPLP